MNRLIAVFASLFIGLADLYAQVAPDRAIVPMIVEKNRPYVDLTFRKADGSTRKARFLLDTGGGGFLLAEGLARDLGLTLGETSREEGQIFAMSKTLPTVFVGDFPLTLNPERVIVMIGASNSIAKINPTAEGMLPGHVMSRYHVVFDYPKQTLTIAQPNVLVPQGEPMPISVSRVGFPRTEVEVHGTRYGLLLDTGASFTMVSEVLLKSLGAAHPDWKRYPGAYGDAATLGGMTLETMFIPRATWGTHPLTEFGIVSQHEGTFERYMSGMMASPIIGSLAGNMLKEFRVEIDYAHGTLYLSRP